jgi:predicted O-linked N-acetylglucosamine transferase (SPINDLY family)
LHEVSSVTAAIEREPPKVGRTLVPLFVVGALAGLALGFPAAYALLRPNTAAQTKKMAFLISDSQEALGSSKPERALALMLEAGRIDPESEVIQNNLCVALNLLEHFEAAIVACNAAIRLNDQFQLARNNLAWAKSARDRAKATAAAPSKP